MTAEIATTGNSNPFLAFAAVAGNNRAPRMRYGKFDEFIAGPDDTKVEKGTEFVAEVPSSLSAVWTLWADGKPAEQHRGLIADAYMPPPRSSLGHTDQSLWPRGDDGVARDPWAFSNELTLTSLDGSESYTFTTSSRGGIGALGDLARVFGKRMRSHPDELPVIALDSSSYRHQTYGEIRVPVFRIVRWIKQDRQTANTANAPRLAPKQGAEFSDDIPW